MTRQREASVQTFNVMFLACAVLGRYARSLGAVSLWVMTLAACSEGGSSPDSDNGGSSAGAMGGGAATGDAAGGAVGVGGLGGTGAAGGSGAVGGAGGGGAVGGAGIGGAVGGAGAAGGGGTAGGGGSLGGGGGSTGQVVNNVRFVGRVETSDPEQIRLAWSGTGMLARFSGSEIAVRLEGDQQYTVVIDGQVQDKYTSTGGWDTLVEDLEDAEHSIEIYRRTEANQGVAIFSGFDVGDGELLDPPEPAERRLEIVGDSITCGYGNEGEDMNCGFSPDTENHYLTYGAMAARQLGAELSTVAWSGKGAVCNYGDAADSCQDAMPLYYDRTLPSDSTSLWTFSRFQPQAVVINLGTNDFSTEVDPTQEQFEQGYSDLLDHVRAENPNALILCSVGPLLAGQDLTDARTYINNVVAAHNDAGDAKVKSFEFNPMDASDGYGCDWHPSIATHEIMAGVLVQVLKAELGW